LPKNVRTAKGQLKALVRHAPAPAAQNPVKATWQKFFPASQAEKQRLAKQREQVHPRVPKTVMEVQLGFYENWDTNSYDSLVRHADQLTHICPTWMSVIDGEGT